MTAHERIYEALAAHDAAAARAAMLEHLSEVRDVIQKALDTTPARTYEG
jgi:DNA-binding FadR family transcriptional regulator